MLQVLWFPLQQFLQILERFYRNQKESLWILANQQLHGHLAAFTSNHGSKTERGASFSVQNWAMGYDSISIY